MDGYISQADYDRLKADYESTLSALSEQLEEVETLQARVSELEPLEGRIREMTHTRAFDKIAEELGVRPEAREDAFKLMGYTPEGEEVDEVGLRKAATEFLKGKPYLMAEGKTIPNRLPRDEFSGKGGGGSVGAGARSVTRGQLRDPAFTSKNAELLSDPGSYEIVD